MKGVDSRTMGSHENKQQDHAPDEERKDRPPLAGHVVLKLVSTARNVRPARSAAGLRLYIYTCQCERVYTRGETDPCTVVWWNQCEPGFA
jgi:hypothetical protein